MKASSQEGKILKERYKIINKFKTSDKQLLYLVEDITCASNKILKKISVKETSLTVDVLDKIFNQQSLPFNNYGSVTPKILDFFLEEDLYIILEYIKDKSMKSLKKYPSIGHIMLNKYVIVAGISSGGFGNVYLAGDINLENKFWAIKEMQNGGEDTELIKKSFKKEARILSQMEHPRIPRITDFFIQKDKYYMVMDYIQGETLSSYITNLKSDEYLSEEKVINWGIQICEVIDYLHHLDTPVIFRDLKPDNIIIARDGSLKLVDFGIARIFQSFKSQSTRYAFLTQGYAAPEQWMGKAEFCSDVYSLGATLHHLITKVHPQESSPDFSPPSNYNSNISKKLDSIILKSLELKRSDRYSSISEIKEELLQIKKINEDSKEIEKKSLKEKPEIEEAVQEETVQEEAVQEETVQEEAVQEETVQEETVQEEAVQEETVQEEAVQEETVQEEAVQEETVQEEAVQEETVQEEAVQEETVQEETVQEETVQEETVQEETVQEEAVQEETVQEETVEEEAVQEVVLQKEVVKEKPVKGSEKKLMCKADELRKEGAWQDAIELYEDVIEINPDKASAYYGVGVCCDELGYLDDALENYQIYRDKVKDPVKKEKIEKKINKLLKEIEEEEERLATLERQREEKYREFLEIKWMNGVFEIPNLPKVRQRLKIEEERAKKIEQYVKINIESSLEKEKGMVEQTRKPVEKPMIALPEKSWGEKSPQSQVHEKEKIEMIALPVKSKQEEMTQEQIDEKLSAKEESRKNYYMAVEMAWADGTVDEYEFSYLQKMRSATGISDEDALEIEREIKEKFKQKIKMAKQDWLREEKKRRAEEKSIGKADDVLKDFNTQYKPVSGQDLIEVRQAEADEARRRAGEAKKLLEQELKEKEEACKQYKAEVESLWETGKLNENIYSELRRKRTLLGLSDREALEIERGFEKLRKTVLEEKKSLEDEKKLTANEEEQKKKELVPLTIEGFSMKGVSEEGLKGSLIVREFHGSGLNNLRAFLVMATGAGQYDTVSDNASSIAVKAFSKALLESKDNFTVDPAKCRALLEELLQISISQVLYKAYTDKLPSVKINIIALLIIHNHYLIGNIGNTLAFVINKNKIRQITREHATKTIRAKTLHNFLTGEKKIKPTIFPMNMETFFDILPGEIIFLCDRDFVDIIGADDIKKQMTEMENLHESSQALANLAYIIKDGTEDVVISAVELGKTERSTSTSIIQYDKETLPVQRDTSLLDKIKKLFKT